MLPHLTIKAVKRQSLEPNVSAQRLRENSGRWLGQGHPTQGTTLSALEGVQMNAQRPLLLWSREPTHKDC